MPSEKDKPKIKKFTEEEKRSYVRAHSLIGAKNGLLSYSALVALGLILSRKNGAAELTNSQFLGGLLTSATFGAWWKGSNAYHRITMFQLFPTTQPSLPESIERSKDSDNKISFPRKPG